MLDSIVFYFFAGVAVTSLVTLGIAAFRVNLHDKRTAAASSPAAASVTDPYAG